MDQHIIQRKHLARVFIIAVPSTRVAGGKSVIPYLLATHFQSQSQSPLDPTHEYVKGLAGRGGDGADGTVIIVLKCGTATRRFTVTTSKLKNPRENMRIVTEPGVAGGCEQGRDCVRALFLFGKKRGSIFGIIVLQHDGAGAGLQTPALHLITWRSAPGC